MARILLVEDDDDIALALSLILRSGGHTTDRVREGRAGLAELRSGEHELVLLDIGLPDIDGWTVLSGIRETSAVPVLMLTAAGRDEDKLRGLLGGADDYLTKPFTRTVLTDHVHRLLSRHAPVDDLEHGDVLLSPRRHAVTVAGDDVGLTPLEHRVLAVLLQRRGEDLSPRDLLRAVWGGDAGVGVEHVCAAVEAMSAKVGWDAPTVVGTPQGTGYRLDAPA